ncbi:MAG TPA: SsrA-binding protein SmpB [Candidatus Saccharimonadales bacterium]|nr:SsrA-binding protein SmpB [Candidatus Saccharimonadales bacterium]
MAKAKPKKPAIVNRRAGYDYQLGDELVVGLELTGPEVRAARDGHLQLKGSYVNISREELWLIGASFSLKLNEKGGANRTVDDRPRRLLARRREIENLAAQRKQGLTIVPLRLLNRGRYIKLVIALGKGKKRYDKRQALKKRDVKRDINRVLKSR